MPQAWTQDQLNIIADFLFDSHEDFGGKGKRPENIQDGPLSTGATSWPEQRSYALGLIRVMNRIIEAT